MSDKKSPIPSSSGSFKKYRHPNNGGIPKSASTGDEIESSDGPTSSISITNSEVINDYLAPSAKSVPQSSNSYRYSSSKQSDNHKNHDKGGYFNKNKNRSNDHRYNKSYTKSSLNDNPRSKEEELKALQRSKRFANPTVPVNANSYGFVSRGEDNRLQKSHRERQKFFNMILLTFIEYCNLNSTHSLSKSFNQLVNKSDVLETGDGDIGEIDKTTKQNEITLDSILSSLRKLREALLYIEHPKTNSTGTNLKNKEIDQFTARVYLFSIRLSCNIGHYQTYIPSINHLIHNKSLLKDEEYEEITILLILHLLHFNNLQSKAIKIYYDNNLHRKKTNASIKLWQVLQSWIHQDYVKWFKIYNAEKDSCKLTIMNFGYDRIIKHMIQVINQSYFTILEQDLYNDLLQQEYLRSKCDINELIDKYKLDWKIQDGKEDDSNRLVIIKQRRGATSS